MGWGGVDKACGKEFVGGFLKVVDKERGKGGRKIGFAYAFTGAEGEHNVFVVFLRGTEGFLLVVFCALAHSFYVEGKVGDVVSSLGEVVAVCGGSQSKVGFLLPVGAVVPGAIAQKGKGGGLVMLVALCGEIFYGGYHLLSLCF